MVKGNLKTIGIGIKSKMKKSPLISGVKFALLITAFLMFLIFIPPRQGMFGSSIEFTKILLVLPFFILIFSLIFHGIKDKIIFLYISLVPVYILIGREAFYTNFDIFIVNLFLGYIMFPILGVLTIEILKVIFRGIRKLLIFLRLY